MSEILSNNRQEANQLVNRQGREKAIIQIMSNYGLPMTARMIMKEMNTQDPNNVRPRLTEMTQKGIIRVLSKPVKENGRNVSQYELRKQSNRLKEENSGQVGFDLWRQ